jgi:hypothetical protein
MFIATGSSKPLSCSRGPVGRLPSVKGSTGADRSQVQVRTSDGFVRGELVVTTFVESRYRSLGISVLPISYKHDAPTVLLLSLSLARAQKE